MPPNTRPFFKRITPPGISLLWLAVILAAISFLVAIIPIRGNDFWWQLKLGELIFNQRAIPTTNIFAWTLPPDHPFFYGAWLGELLLYLPHRLGGLELLIFVRNLLALAFFALVAYEARQRSGSWRIAAFVVLLFYVMALNNLTLRTQIWAWLPFMLIALVLHRFTSGKCSPSGYRQWLLLCPLLMLVWVNVHGSYILGLVLVGSYLVGEALRALFKQPGALDPTHIAWLGIASALTAAATLVNPRGIGIYTYFMGLMTDAPSQGLIAEWQSPSPNGIANLAFFVSILLLILVLAYSRYRPSLTDLLLILGFLWLAWSGQRYIVWFGAIAMPILAQGLAQIPNRLPVFTEQRSWLNAVIILLLFIPALLVQPWFVSSLPLPQSYWQIAYPGSPEGPLVGLDTPIEAAAYLKTHPGGRLFNEMGYGSYLIWALPDQGVFIDPRVELYPYEQWQDYIHISQGIQYAELLERYGADRVLLDVYLQAGLAEALASDPGWHMEFSTSRTQLWTRVEK